MISIVKGNWEHASLLAEIATKSFIESHGTSAPPETIDQYVGQKFTVLAFHEELCDLSNIYNIIFDCDEPVGYSKILLDCYHPDLGIHRPTKLERLYLLQSRYGSGLGKDLLNFNVKFSREHEQDGMWLFTWKENTRAVQFYQRNNFRIVGSYDFKLSETHSNPNHLMVLKY